MSKITHIGIRVKKLRIEKGFSQDELASLLNISQSNISRLEIGELEPNMFHLAMLKRLLNTNYDYLIEGINSPKSSPNKTK